MKFIQFSRSVNDKVKVKFVNNVKKFARIFINKQTNKKKKKMNKFNKQRVHFFSIN